MLHPVLDLEQLLRVPHVDPDLGYDISPDGKRIAFAWNPTGQWEIYEVNLYPNKKEAIDPTNSSKPQPQINISPQLVSEGDGAKFAPRYSPNGRKLAYAVDLEGGENFDIYVFDRDTGEHVNLTPNTPDAIQPNTCWSPDGSQIAFLWDRSGCFQTYVMPAEGGEARLILDIPFPGWDVRWSPDGRHIAVVVEGRGQDFHTYIVPVDGGEAWSLAIENEAINAFASRWSPDGMSLAFSSDYHGYYNLGIYELETRKITWVTDGEGDKGSPSWSPDGEKLAFVLSKGAQTWLGILQLGDKSIRYYQIEPGVIYEPRFTSDGEGLVFIFENYRHPDDFWQFSLADEKMHQLTQSLPPEVQNTHFIIPREINYPAMDGASVPAILFKPQQSEPLPPAVVIIHGGPTWLFQFFWYPIMQHMASRGWVVLAPNYRGSSGYGREWQLANRFDLGGVDTRDVVAGADYLVKEGLADPARIAVTGTSHGGYLTMTCLTQYPDRWAAGSAVVPFLNWFTSHKNSREDLQHWDRENFGDPQENYNLWYERSPFFFLDRIQAPVQLICGAHDPRCPASESIAARDALVTLKKPVDFVLYPDEGHGFLKIENVVDATLKRAAFLAKALEAEGHDEK
ncbi:MAG: alpha/beta fold hydrolase [Anaerolineales bacterium]